MDDQEAVSSDIDSTRAKADHFRRVATAWLIVFVVSLLTVLASIGLVWSERHLPKRMFIAQAVVLEDGSYAFYLDGTGPMAIGEHPEQFAKDVHMSLRPTLRSHGWLGRTRFRRSLHFQFKAWTPEWTPIMVDEPLRRRLSEELVAYVCQSMMADETATECPYFEILDVGRYESRTGNPGTDVQFDVYSIENVRISGYLHNLVTLIALGLLLHGVIQFMRANKQRRRWIKLALDGTCPCCGYDTRKLPEPRCPECGTAL